MEAGIPVRGHGGPLLGDEPCISPIISFFLARVTLKGIEVVTFRDGIAALLVVSGILVMPWA
jgi:hypothetical protein